MFEIKVDNDYVHISIKRGAFVKVLKELIKKLNMENPDAKT